MTSAGIVAVGVLGQVLFGARMAVQWAASERAGRPTSPALFWQLSVLGTIALSAYALLRRDLAIVVGQGLVYLVSLRNLHLMERWRTLPAVVRWTAYVLPAASVGALAWGAPETAHELVRNETVSGWLLTWGIAGQLVFTLRFVVQWIVAEARKRSDLPAAFWVLSLLGSGMIIVYAALRRDPVLLAANLAGCVAYARNLTLQLRRHRGPATPSGRRRACNRDQACPPSTASRPAPSSSTCTSTSSRSSCRSGTPA